jgi:hypothetical protein
MLPTLVVAIFAAAEMAAREAERAVLQDAADTAALSGARELHLPAAAAIEARAERLAIARVRAAGGSAAIAAEATTTANSLRVVMTSRRESIVGKLVPLGGVTTVVEATARAGGGTLAIDNGDAPRPAPANAPSTIEARLIR